MSPIKLSSSRKHQRMIMLRNCYNAYQIGVSAFITHIRELYSTYPVPTGGKDKNQTPPRWKASDVIVMFK